MKIVIVGGGFAGIACAKSVSAKLKNHSNIEILLLDRYRYATMLPSLPDIAGGKIKKRYASENIKKLLPTNVRFQKIDIQSINLDSKTILGQDGEVVLYDQLVIAAGSKAISHGFENGNEKVHVLNGMKDALKINREFEKRIFEQQDLNVVIVGAGFTGLELASNLYHLALEKKAKVEINIVARGKKLMSLLSQKLIGEIEKECKFCQFNVLKEEEVIKFENNTVYFKKHDPIENAFFCWCAGVKVAVDIVGNYQKIKDGRIIVDRYLRIPEYQDVYVVGDAAAIELNGNYIRRAVNFAQMSGICAGNNIAREIKHKPLQEFHPVDLGWVIPINDSSVGVTLGVPIKGRMGLFLHYLLCGIKNYNIRNSLQFVYYACKFSVTKHTKIDYHA